MTVKKSRSGLSLSLTGIAKGVKTITPLQMVRLEYGIL